MGFNSFNGGIIGKANNPTASVATGAVRTSYNTSAGVYYDPETRQPTQDQSKAFRKNYAGIGYTYDPVRDAFIPPKPFNSWILNEDTCCWDPPVSYPNDGNQYYWDEENLNWVAL